MARTGAGDHSQPFDGFRPQLFKTGQLARLLLLRSEVLAARLGCGRRAADLASPISGQEDVLLNSLQVRGHEPCLRQLRPDLHPQCRRAGAPMVAGGLPDPSVLSNVRSPAAQLRQGSFPRTRSGGDCRRAVRLQPACSPRQVPGRTHTHPYRPTAAWQSRCAMKRASARHAGCPARRQPVLSGRPRQQQAGTVRVGPLQPRPAN